MSREPTILLMSVPAGIGGELWCVPHRRHGSACCKLSTAHIQHTKLPQGVMTGRLTTHLHLLHSTSSRLMGCDGQRNLCVCSGSESPQLGCAVAWRVSAVGLLLGLPRVIFVGRPPSACILKCSHTEQLSWECSTHWNAPIVVLLVACREMFVLHALHMFCGCMSILSFSILIPAFLSISFFK